MANELNIADPDFVINFVIPALEDALCGRDLQIVTSRLGLSGKNPMTLGQIGMNFNISRERVRQIVERSIKRIARKGQRQILYEKTEAPCSQLMAVLTSKIRPLEDGYKGRMLSLFEVEGSKDQVTSQLVRFYVSLLFPYEIRKEILSAFKICEKRRRFKPRVIKSTSTKFQRVYNQIIWKGDFWSPSSYSHIDTAVRDVSSDISHAGTYYSKKLAREVQYESTLEYQFFLQLEQADDVVWYQEQPLALSYNIDGHLSKYIPDVFIQLLDGRVFVTEIKPRFLMPLIENVLKWEALKSYCEERGWGALMTDGRTSPNALGAFTSNEQFAAEILNRLQLSSLNWNEYRDISQRYKASFVDFASLILNAKLSWSLGPFKLVKALRG